jgi:hypothetical protein
MSFGNEVFLTLKIFASLPFANHHFEFVDYLKIFMRQIEFMKSTPDYK